MLGGAGGLLSRCTLTRGSHRTIDPLCLENPRPAGAEPTLTENVASPFQAEPRQGRLSVGGFPDCCCPCVVLVSACRKMVHSCSRAGIECDSSSDLHCQSR